MDHTITTTEAQETALTQIRELTNAKREEAAVEGELPFPDNNAYLQFVMEPVFNSYVYQTTDPLVLKDAHIAVLEAQNEALKSGASAPAPAKGRAA